MMDLINKVKGWFIMDEAKLFVICATLCIMTGIGAIGYYNIQSNAMMSRNIENGIDRKSTRLNSSHSQQSRMPSSA